MSPDTEKLLHQFKALADSSRVRLVMLCAAAECSVSELTEVMGQSQPRISQHLKQLCAVDLLERFRDGHYVYYRVPTDGRAAVDRRRLLSLLPEDEPQFRLDLERLRALRAHDDSEFTAESDRLLHRALVELTVAAPLGDLLDVGCGQGRLLKLLASRAHRVVGVDIDPDARRFARAEVLLAGLPNCSLRQGDMNALPFGDAEFDTIILDDVLTGAPEPERVVREALRLLRPAGRIIVLASVDGDSLHELRSGLSTLAAAAGLRLAAPRAIPDDVPAWLLAVATRTETDSVAA